MSKNKSYLSRRDFLRIAGLAAAGGVLAACSTPTTAVPATPIPPTAVPATAAAATAVSATSAPATEQPTQAPNPTAAPTKAAAIELSYTFLAWGPMQDVQLVADEISKMTLDKINATVKLVPLDSSAFDQKMQLSLAAAEQMDLMFTCNWTNNFYTDVDNGALLALDDLLPKNAPKYWASIAPGVWDAGRVGGKLYGAINQQIWASVNGFDFRKDLLDKYSWDPNTLKTYADIEKYWAVIKKNEPDIYPTGWFQAIESNTWWPSYYGLDAIGPSNTIFVSTTDQQRKLAMIYDAPEFKDAIDTAYRWVNAGYVPPEPTQAEEFVTNMKAGKYAAVPSNWAKPGRASEDKAKYGFDFVSVPDDTMFKPWIGTGTVAATMNGIVKTTKDADRTAQLLELLNTDVQIYTTICKGVEGKHWAWVDQSLNLIGFPAGVTADNSQYNPNTDWMFGNQFNAPYIDKAQAEEKAWDETKALNENAVVSVMMGFAFINDPVKTEIAQVASVNTEQGIPLSQGLVDPSKLTDYAQKMKAAGAEKIRDEAQTQITAWLKAKS